MAFTTFVLQMKWTATTPDILGILELHISNVGLYIRIRKSIAHVNINFYALLEC